MSDDYADLRALTEAIQRADGGIWWDSETAQELESLRVSRVNGLELDWESPGSLWLNGFACIHPTDAFAAEVGRSIIRTVMQAYPARAAFTVHAS